MIRRVSAPEFVQMFPHPAHIYNSVAFAEHNRTKCDGKDLRYLFISDSKVRFGVILGRRDDALCSPFSAPFGGLVSNRTQQFDLVDDAWRQLLQYAEAEGCRLHVTLPPAIYDSATTARSVYSLTKLGLTPSVDVSYHIDLDANDIVTMMAASSRNHLKRANAGGLVFEKLRPVHADIARVYRIIEANHQSRNHRMAMSLADVESTAALVCADIFIVSHEGNDIAAAIVYPSADGVIQLINWGDMPGFSHLRPMNFFAAKLYEYYKAEGRKILDLGPASSSQGVTDFGLAAFKESLGAVPTLKFTFRQP